MSTHRPAQAPRRDPPRLPSSEFPLSCPCLLVPLLRCMVEEKRLLRRTNEATCNWLPATGYWLKSAAGSPGWGGSPAPGASRGNRENLRPCRDAVCVASRKLRREQPPRPLGHHSCPPLRGC